MSRWPETLDYASFLQPNDTIVWNHGSSEPTAAVRQLLDQRHTLPQPLTVFLSGVSVSGILQPEHADRLRFRGIGGMGTLSKLARAGCIDVVPCKYSDMPRLVASDRVHVDVVIVSTSLPDDDGFVSLGATVDMSNDMLDVARVKVAEVNPNVPYTYGDTLVPLERFDVVSYSEAPLPELAPPGAPTAEIETICATVAGYIGDGATIQTGIGSVGAYLPTMLRDRRHLGVHSGLLIDGMMDLAERGVIDGTRKEIDPGLCVAGGMLGSAALYRWAHRNPAVAIRRTSHMLSPAVIGGFERFVSVNSAIEVDLMGQVNAESLGGSPVGAVGGQVDYVRGATLSTHGVSIIALQATAGRHGSRIVPALDRGIVTTSRSDVDVVVTEFGAAELRGKTVSERIAAMIGIAHPDHRDELRRAAADLGLATS